MSCTVYTEIKAYEVNVRIPLTVGVFKTPFEDKRIKVTQYGSRYLDYNKNFYCFDFGKAEAIMNRFNRFSKRVSVSIEIKSFSRDNLPYEFYNNVF